MPKHLTITNYSHPIAIHYSAAQKTPAQIRQHICKCLNWHERTFCRKIKLLAAGKLHLTPTDEAMLNHILGITKIHSLQLKTNA